LGGGQKAGVCIAFGGRNTPVSWQYRHAIVTSFGNLYHKVSTNPLLRVNILADPRPLRVYRFRFGWHCLSLAAQVTAGL
jgi:hypothetical protein